MNIVEPIRDFEKIKEIYYYMKKTSDRDALMFLFGVYTGLRISDMLPFKVKDCMQKYYNIRERKTGKQRTYNWNPQLYRELKKYIEGKEAEEYLFKSRKGQNRPITRNRAYTIIRTACNACGVYNVGTHTLRKTFGLFLYQQSKKNIGMIMDVLNHSSESITLRYIGINQEENNSAIKKLKYF